MFMDQVRYGTNTTSTNYTAKASKPQYPVMESCTHDWVVALRMGATDLVMDLLNDSVDAQVRPRMQQLHEQYMAMMH